MCLESSVEFAFCWFFHSEKETNKILAFLDVCINNSDPSCLKTSTYRKKTFTGLLTTFFSFTSFSYKVGLIRTWIELTT